MDEQTGWVEWIGRATATTLLAAVLVTGYMGVWVFGSTYAEVKAQRDEWKVLALEGLKTAELAQHIRLTPPAPNSVTPTEVRERLKSVQQMEP